VEQLASVLVEALSNKHRLAALGHLVSQTNQQQLHSEVTLTLATLSVYCNCIMSSDNYTSIFQAEVYAVMHSAQILEQIGVDNEQINICSDSQAALKALSNPRITSRLVWDCIVALQQLSSHNAVKLFWIPGHSGIYSNEPADQLAKAASFKSYVGPEPVLPVSTSVIQSQLQAWTLRETQTRWQNLKSCRQAKETIDGLNHQRTK